MINIKRIDHFLITVPEGESNKALQFYKNIIKLKQIPGNHPNNALWFQWGNMELHIREEKIPSYLSHRHIAFEVENLQEIKDFLTKQNIELSYSTDIEGRERYFFRDPFGNRFELLEYNKTK